LGFGTSGCGAGACCTGALGGGVAGCAIAALVQMIVRDEMRSALQARVMCLNDPSVAAKRKHTVRMSVGSPTVMRALRRLVLMRRSAI
jgi:hypothetical protein